MTGVPIQSPSDVSDLAGIEHQLATALTDAADEIKHAECFDDEQRAEVYAILQALRDDTEAHRAMVDLLARQLRTGGARVMLEQAMLREQFLALLDKERQAERLYADLSAPL